MQTARCAWEVMAGVVPGKPDPQFTKRWGITSKEWAELNDREDITPEHPDNLFTRYQREAYEYARDLTDPRMVNWVRVDFIWF